MRDFIRKKLLKQTYPAITEMIFECLQGDCDIDEFLEAIRDLFPQDQRTNWKEDHQNYLLHYGKGFKAALARHWKRATRNSIEAYTQDHIDGTTQLEFIGVPRDLLPKIAYIVGFYWGQQTALGFNYAWEHRNETNLNES